MTPLFDDAVTARLPFPHLHVPRILPPEEADRVLHWLRTEAPWTLRVESFYEQHEFSLQAMALAPCVAGLVADRFVNAARQALAERLNAGSELALVDISAHRLTAGQTIRIHNDYIGEEETHRLLIQLNDGWSAERGGLLMLFAREQPESLQRIVMPSHGSGFAFEISPVSFHAVSSIQEGERFTLVYTFRRVAEHRPTGDFR